LRVAAESDPGNRERIGIMKLFSFERNSLPLKLYSIIISISLVLLYQPIAAQSALDSKMTFPANNPVATSIMKSLVPEPAGARATLGSLLPDLKDDIVYLVQEPDFYLIIGAVGATPVVFNKAVKQEDPGLNEMWGNSGFADGIFEFGDGMGNAIIPLAASGLSLSIGKIGHIRAVETFGSDLFRAQAVNGLLTLSMKRLIDRRRPNGGPYSYPSGHTSTAFTTAGVLNHHFGPYVGIPAHIAAAYVGFSRLQENRHYLSDIVAGAIIGSYVSYKVTHRTGEQSHFDIMPLVGDGNYGARLSLNF